MVKTISLADDAYEALDAARVPGESFSDVARRLARQEAARALFDRDVRVDLKARDADAWKKDLYAERDRSRTPRAGSS